MTKQEEVINEIKSFPDYLLNEALDFITYLKTKSIKEKYEATIISESSLKKDWLLPEEDEAWKDL